MLKKNVPFTVASSQLILGPSKIDNTSYIYNLEEKKKRLIKLLAVFSDTMLFFSAYGCYQK